MAARPQGLAGPITSQGHPHFTGGWGARTHGPQCSETFLHWLLSSSSKPGALFPILQKRINTLLGSQNIYQMLYMMDLIFPVFLIN